MEGSRRSWMWPPEGRDRMRGEDAAENVVAIRTAPQPGQPARRLLGRGIAGGGQRVRARQVLLLEAREPGLDRCEPRVLFPWPPADFVYSCSVSLLSRYGFAGLRLHPLLVAGIPSPVEHRQPQAPLRQR